MGYIVEVRGTWEIVDVVKGTWEIVDVVRGTWEIVDVGVWVANVESSIIPFLRKVFVLNRMLLSKHF